MENKNGQAKSLKITLVKSPISSLENQKATLEALGLHKLTSVAVQPDNECTRGKIFRVKHLVKVEEL